MDISAAKSRFGALSRADKVIVLLHVMHGLTIAMRGIFIDYAHDCETRSRLAYEISQLNHRLTSAAWAMMQARETYPDEELVDMLCKRPRHPELEPYFPHVLEQAMEYLSA